jgi:chaperonin GroES
LVMEPIADRLIVKQAAAEEATKSGILLSVSAQEKPQIYEVLEAGPGGLVDGSEIKMVVKKGDRVIISRYAGTIVRIDGVEMTIIRQSDVLAIVRGDGAFSLKENPHD